MEACGENTPQLQHKRPGNKLFRESGCRESNSVLTNPNRAYYRCTTPRDEEENTTFHVFYQLKLSSGIFSVFVVTNIFPDGKISRPRLAVFAFRYAQTKTSFRLPHVRKNPQ